MFKNSNYCAVRFNKDKPFAAFRNFAIGGFLMLFCAVFIRISVRFCSVRTPLTPPSKFNLKTELRHFKIPPDRTTATPRDAKYV